MRRGSGVRRVALCGLIAAVAFALSFLESLIPFPMPLPGMKLGLANIATLFAVYALGAGEAALMVLTRCLLSALLFGGPTQLAFSLAGGMLALAVMELLRRLPGLSAYGVSVAGAAAHNIAQVAVAAFTLSTPAIWGYLAWLLPVSVVTGWAVALVYLFAWQRLRAPVRRMLGTPAD